MIMTMSGRAISIERKTLSYFLTATGRTRLVWPV